MSKNLLITLPETRINDLFVKPGSKLNFNLVNSNYKDPIVQGGPVGLRHNHDFRFKAGFYQKIGVDIVVETALDYPYAFITEKTYRPISHGRPFIIVGPFGTLEFLKSLGFMTFSSIIDESYDTLSDAEERFYRVCQSVKEFVDRPIHDVIDDIARVKPELTNNINCLTSLKQKQLQYLKEQIKID